MLELPGGHAVGVVVDAVCDVLEVPDGGAAGSGDPLQVLDIERLLDGLDLFDDDPAAGTEPPPAGG